MRRKFLHLISLLSVCIALTSCDQRPSENAIAQKFVKDHPETTVLKVKIGSGDNDGTDYHIDYITPPDRTPRSALWLVHWGLLKWDYSESDFGQIK